MGRSRLLIPAGGCRVSPRRSQAGGARVESALSPRFLCRSIPARCPLSPRKVRRLHAPIASIADFRLHQSPTGSPLPTRNEAETGLVLLRLAGSPFEASPSGLPRSTPDWLHVEWVIYMVSSFHLTRSARLCLAHRRSRRRAVQVVQESAHYRTSLEDAAERIVASL